MFRRLLTSSLVMALLLSVIPMPFANAAAIEFTDTVQAQLNATADRAGEPYVPDSLNSTMISNPNETR